MDRDSLLSVVRDSLASITDARFYETERGFQGQLLVALSSRIPKYFGSWHGIIEQEYQKTLFSHGLNIRPDIVIHQPFNPNFHKSRREGNFVVIELKLRATPKMAIEDMTSLASMLGILKYQFGIFINIGSHKTHADKIPEGARGKIRCFAVRLEGDKVCIHEAWT